MPRTPDPVRAALRALRDRYAPSAVNGSHYEPPAPLVVIPEHLHPKGTEGKRLTDAHTAYLSAAALLEQAEDGLNNAESDFKSRDEWIARRDEMAGRLARGEVQADAVEALLPTFSEADHLARCETHAVAVATARRNVACAVSEYDRAAEEIAPTLVPAAVSNADRLDQEARTAEAAASSARYKASEAKQVARDLYLPAAMSAVRSAKVGVTGGVSIHDRAVGLRNIALISPADGWSTDAALYDRGHPRFAEAAKYLGLRLISAPVLTLEQREARERIAEARGDYADTMPKMVGGRA